MPTTSATVPRIQNVRARPFVFREANMLHVLLTLDGAVRSHGRQGRGMATRLAMPRPGPAISQEWLALDLDGCCLRSPRQPVFHPPGLVPRTCREPVRLSVHERCPLVSLPDENPARTHTRGNCTSDGRGSPRPAKYQ